MERNHPLTPKWTRLTGPPVTTGKAQRRKRIKPYGIVFSRKPSRS